MVTPVKLFKDTFGEADRDHALISPENVDFARSLERFVVLASEGELPLLFGTRIAVDSVWPNNHRSSMHLLLKISLLESPGNLIMSEFAPSFRLPEPLRTVSGVSFRALAAQ